MVGHMNLRYIKEMPVWPMLTRANTEFCFFAAHRQSTNTANFTTKASHSLKDLSTYTHARSYGVAYRRTRAWHAPITTPNDPVKLCREPGGFPTFPIWKHRTSYA